MLFGYDIGKDFSVCAFRELPEENISVAILLFGFGTVPHRNAAVRDGIQRGLDTTMRRVMDAVEETLRSDGRNDLRYAATRIVDSVHLANGQVREASLLMGQGIYVGGVIAYVVKNDYIMFPFGGGAVYIFDHGNLHRQAVGDPADGLIRDAIGCSQQWKGRCWQGTLLPGGSLFCLSEKLADPAMAAGELQTALFPGSHPNTPSMLLRRTKTPEIPAVMELRNA